MKNKLSVVIDQQQFSLLKFLTIFLRSSELNLAN